MEKLPSSLLSLLEMSYVDKPQSCMFPRLSLFRSMVIVQFLICVWMFRSLTYYEIGEQQLQRTVVTGGPPRSSSGTIRLGDAATGASIMSSRPGDVITANTMVGRPHQPPTSVTANGTAWCVVDDDNTYNFLHFPHAAQTLFPCWSWFQQHPHLECGFYKNSKKLRLAQPWINFMVHDLMGCQVRQRNFPPPKNDSTTQHPQYRPDVLRGVEPARWLDERNTEWFSKPSDAEILRKRLRRMQHSVDAADDDHDSTREYNGDGLVVSPSPSAPTLRIGFVNRPGNREVLNMEEIRDSVIQAYPHALISPVYFMENFTTIAEQLRYFERHDVMIIPHGASVTSAIVMPQNAAVVEIYPLHYFPLTFFPKLLRSAGIRHYGYYHGVPDPVNDFRLHCLNDTGKMQYQTIYRNTKLKPPVVQIVKLVEQAIENATYTISS